MKCLIIVTICLIVGVNCQVSKSCSYLWCNDKQLEKYIFFQSDFAAFFLKNKDVCMSEFSVKSTDMEELMNGPAASNVSENNKVTIKHLNYINQLIILTIILVLR